MQRRNPLNNNKMAPTPVASSHPTTKQKEKNRISREMRLYGKVIRDDDDGNDDDDGSNNDTARRRKAAGVPSPSAFYVSPQRRLFVEEDESTLDDDDDHDNDDNTRARLEVAEQARNRLEKDFTDVLALLSERMREVEQLRKERDELRKERDQERDDNAILKGEHRDFWSRMQSAIKTMRLAIHEARTELDWFRSLGLLSWGTGEDDEDVSLCVSDDGHSDTCWWK